MSNRTFALWWWPAVFLINVLGLWLTRVQHQVWGSLAAPFVTMAYGAILFTVSRRMRKKAGR